MLSNRAYARLEAQPEESKESSALRYSNVAITNDRAGSRTSATGEGKLKSLTNWKGQTKANSIESVVLTLERIPASVRFQLSVTVLEWNFAETAIRLRSRAPGRSVPASVCPGRGLH
jgi:hypothetical protein